MFRLMRYNRRSSSTMRPLGAPLTIVGHRAAQRHRPRLFVAMLATLALVLAACGTSSANGSSKNTNGATTTTSSTNGSKATNSGSSGGAVPFLSNCSKPNTSALANTTFPSSLLPDLPTPAQITKNDTAAAWGGTPGTKETPKPFTAVKITPAEATKICNKHLSAVFLNWSNVVYNKAIVDGIRNEFNAVGVKLIRVTTSSFSATGLAGNVSAVMPLNPNIVLVGGTINPSQMSSLMAPVISSHKILVSWGNDGPGLKLGQSGTLQALIGYDWYFLGEEMANAIHQAFPHGVNLGYIHWINDTDAILLREQGLLDGLKKYSTIHVVTAGGSATPKGTNSGFSQPTATSAEQYAESFLQTHSTVGALFAPWETPPGVGELSAIKALHLTTKVKLVTMDLGTAGAKSLSAKGGIVVDMAEDVYTGGRMMAATAALASIHASYPDFVVIPTEPATPTNVKTAWNAMHGPGLACPC